VTSSGPPPVPDVPWPTPIPALHGLAAGQEELIGPSEGPESR